MIEHHVSLIGPRKSSPYLMKGSIVRKLLVLPHDKVQDFKYVDNHHRIANTPSLYKVLCHQYWASKILQLMMVVEKWPPPTP